MRHILILLLLIGFSFGLHGQSIGNSSWNSIEEFKAEEPSIIENIIWLENNPISTEQNNTKAISEYIISWLSNTPHLVVVLDAVFLDNLLDNKRFKYAEKFKVTYLFGKSLYIIQNQDDLNEVKASVRGIEGMITVYQALKRIDPSIKNATLEKYVKLTDKNKLEDYVLNRLSKASQPLNY